MRFPASRVGHPRGRVRGRRHIVQAVLNGVVFVNYFDQLRMDEGLVSATLLTLFVLPAPYRRVYSGDIEAPEIADERAIA